MQTQTLTTTNVATHTHHTNVIARGYGRVASSNRATWGAQVLLALPFLFAGVMKLVTPADTLAEQAEPFSVEFMRFIGVCEALGAVGLTAPWALGIRRELTPLAAAGLFIIMCGATVSTVATTDAPAGAAVPFAIGVLCAFVATTRARQLSSSERSAVQVQPAA